MTQDTLDYGAPAMIEGIARVVAVDGHTAWLEPEQTTSCGSCASSGACGAKGMGTTASRLEARRFPLDNSEAGLFVGERVVVGVGQTALVKAALVAYALPLVSALAAGGVAQGSAGSDGMTMLAMAVGLGAGLVVARLLAKRLSSRGEIAPRLLRRARLGETCRMD